MVFLEPLPEGETIMTNDITLVIAVLYFVLLIIYFICAAWGIRSKPELFEGISLILTSSGIVSGINLGYIAVFKAGCFVGVLVDQRIPILAGAFAILWVSITASWKIFSLHFQYKPKNANEDK